MEKLKNKTVLITGGLSGIGKSCALAAGREGANLVIADLDTPGREPAMEEIRRTNPKALFVECNVANHQQVGNAVKKAVDTFGRLDVALNNAGIGGEANKVGDMSEAAWLKVIGVNLNGVFNCMNHELAQMSKQQSGVIINMSSILGKVGFANSSHYVAAKHGVLGLTKSAALEYATEGIRINAICPGFIHTPLLENAGITEHSEMEQYIAGLHPMKRLGEPEEVARVFLFLAGEDSSFMTGTAVEVEGGYLIP